MTTTLTQTRRPRKATRPQGPHRSRPEARRRNWLGGLAGWLWLAAGLATWAVGESVRAPVPSARRPADHSSEAGRLA